MKLKRHDLLKKDKKKCNSQRPELGQAKSVESNSAWEMSASEALKVCYVS